MAMSAAVLKADLKPEIKAKIAALFTILGVEGDDILTKFSDAMAEAIANKVVAHITANAVVTVNAVQSGGDTASGTVA